MRTPVFLKWLGGVIGMSLAVAVCGAGADNVVARYHFAGASDLSRETNFAAATKLMGLNTSVTFKRRVVERFAAYLATGLPASGPASGAALQLLVDDFLGAESAASFGGATGGPLQFVVAVKSDANRARLWNDTLAKSCQGAGEPLTVAGVHGLLWANGGASLWILHEGDWLLVGRGTGLQATRDEFLEQIKKQGRPGTALNGSFLEADVDWAKLQEWLPVSFGALKPARTKIELTSGRDQIFHMAAKVEYPEALAWSAQPWRPPLKIISDPLISFTAARDLAPFLAHDVFAGISDDPFPQQFYCWAIANMPFQNFMAWPVANSNELDRLSTELPTTFGPKVRELDNGTLRWMPKQKQIVWSSPMLRMTSPYLSSAESDGQSYLLAGMFPLGKHLNPPQELFEQFVHRDDVVYYDYETTGRRLEQWRLLTELLPIIHKMTQAEAIQERNAVMASTNAPKGEKYRPSFIVADNWLEALAPHLNSDTTTEITKSGPAELTIKRRSPFLFTAIELELLTHWLLNAPAVGHIDPHLLPPAAKVTGPGAH